MDIVTITSKGQITLPKAVRTRMAVRAGDQLAFEFESNGDVRLRALRHDLKPLRGFLAQYAQGKAAAPQAIRDALRKRAAAKQVVFRSSRQDSVN